jgi:hypothetical protein
MKFSGLRQPGIKLFVDVRTGLHVVVALLPVEIDLAVLQRTRHCHGVVADLVGNRAIRQTPKLFGMLAVLRIGDDHVGRQAVRESTDFTRRAAGRRLAGQRERAVARLGNLAGQQVDVIDEVVGPGATGMLVEAHGPEGGDLDLRVGIQLGQGLQILDRNTGKLGNLLGGIFGNELLVFVEGDRPRTCRYRPSACRQRRVTVAGRVLLKGMRRAQAVADVGGALLES